MKKLVLALMIVSVSMAYSQNARNVNIFKNGHNIGMARFWDAGKDWCVNDFTIYNNSPSPRSFSFDIYINGNHAFTGWADLPGGGNITWYNKLLSISENDTIGVRLY